MVGPLSATGLQDHALFRAQQRVGRSLRGKWHIDQLLGVGGMAAVYGATHRNGKRGAIKMLHAELSADLSIRERFLREGRAANRVGHPGAVAVLDDDVAEDGAIYLVMEWLEGESVEARRERAGGRLDVVDVLSIVDQVLDVLVAAHARGIVHRDLKPDNLFVTREGQVRVLDFGIARLRETADRTGTQTGVSMGTPAFMPPEQARGLWDQVDARADIWAVGATLFTCLSGRLVHDGRSVNEQLLCAMTKAAPPIRSVAIHVPSPVAQVIDRALSFDREARFATAIDMQGAVREAYWALHAAPLSSAPRLVVPEISATLPSAGAQLPGGVTGRPVISGRTQPAPRGRGSILPLGVASVGLLVAGVVTAVFLSAGSRRAPEAPVPEASASRGADVLPSSSAPAASSSSIAAEVPSAATGVGKAEVRKAPGTPTPGAPRSRPQATSGDPFERRGR